jgi:hypothetical protein
VLVVVAAATGYGAWRAARARPVAGVYEPTGSIQDLMEGVVEPNADAIFQSVAIVSTLAGTDERVPRTDEEWARVEHAALVLAEAANLLRMPGRAIASHASADSADVVPELTPEQIGRKIAADPVQWTQQTGELMKQARLALQYARTKNVRGLFQMGGDLDEVCENCHLVYWYPNAPKAP